MQLWPECNARKTRHSLRRDIIPGEKITFSDSRYYCVLYADMANSTRMASLISNSCKLKTFYGTFIYSLSGIASSFGARIVKTGGDSIMWYFPESIDCKNKLCFKNVLECGFHMISARSGINSSLQLQGLPPISYRITADCGKYDVLTTFCADTTKESEISDPVGVTVTLFSKMNSLAQPNSITIGGDLYDFVKSSCPEYCFENTEDHFTGLRNAYPVYSVSRNVEIMTNLLVGANSKPPTAIEIRKSRGS